MKMKKSVTLPVTMELQQLAMFVDSDPTTFEEAVEVKYEEKLWNLKFNQLRRLRLGS